MSQPLFIMRILGLARGTPHPFDGSYLKFYDVHAVNKDGTYTGGDLQVTWDLSEALKLPATDLYALWKAQHGTRPDGEPNRPLTAFTVDMRIFEDELRESQMRAKGMH